MQSLREHLLKAGIVTEEQAAKAEARSKRGRSRRSRRGGRRNKSPEVTVAKTEEGAVEAAEATETSETTETKKVAAKDQPVNRLVDVSDPIRLQIHQAIEEHRLRDAHEGEVQFHFTLRDGRIRKMFINKPTSEALEGGKLAIVENGQIDEHIIVDSAAIPAIRTADAEAVRFHNAN